MQFGEEMRGTSHGRIQGKGIKIHSQKKEEYDKIELTRNYLARSHFLSSKEIFFKIIESGRDEISGMKISGDYRFIGFRKSRNIRGKQAAGEDAETISD